MAKINLENWTFTHFKSLNFKVFINLAGHPDPENNEDVKIFYMVTTTSHEDTEVFQREFSKLENAIEFINSGYGNWEFVDLRKSNGEGCGSCAAH